MITFSIRTLSESLFFITPLFIMPDNTNTNQIFEKFIRENLYPTPKERESISEKYNELKDRILPSNIHVFQSGSYARTTACTPL
jgi:hypothetical protein